MVLSGHCRMERSLPDEQTISIVPPPAFFRARKHTGSDQAAVASTVSASRLRESAVANGESWPSQRDASKPPHWLYFFMQHN